MIEFNISEIKKWFAVNKNVPNASTFKRVSRLHFCKIGPLQEEINL